MCAQLPNMNGRVIGIVEAFVVDVLMFYPLLVRVIIVVFMVFSSDLDGFLRGKLEIVR